MYSFLQLKHVFLLGGLQSSQPHNLLQLTGQTGLFIEYLRVNNAEFSILPNQRGALEYR